MIKKIIVVILAFLIFIGTCFIGVTIIKRIIDINKQADTIINYTYDKFNEFSSMMDEETAEIIIDTTG